MPSRSASSVRSRSGDCISARAGRRSSAATPSRSGYSNVSVGEVGLRLLGEEEADERLGRGRVIRGLQDADARDVDERARVAVGEEVVGDRVVLAGLLLGLEQVVVVDERDVDLAGRARPRVRRRCPRRPWARSRRIASSQAFVASSPSDRRSAVTNVWKLALVGAQPTRPFQAGSARSRTDAGQIGVGELARVVGEDASATADADPVAVVGRNRASTRSRRSSGSGASRPSAARAPEGTAVLGEEDVGRAVVALLEDRRGELRGARVADLDVDAGRLLEPREDRADELLAATGVDDDLCLRYVGSGSAAAGWRVRGAAAGCGHEREGEGESGHGGAAHHAGRADMHEEGRASARRDGQIVFLRGIGTPVRAHRSGTGPGWQVVLSSLLR